MIGRPVSFLSREHIRPSESALAERTSAEITRDYIEQHQSILDCLSYDIVNFSALARKIMEETGARNEEAVMIACRRYQIELRNRRVRENDVLSTLKNSRVRLKSKISLVNARNEPRTLQLLQKIQQSIVSRNNTMLTVQQGSRVLTIILDEQNMEETLAMLGKELVINTMNRLGEITVESPEAIVETPGILTRFSSILSEAGVNCLEVVSCNTESTFVVSEQDLVKAYNLLHALVS